MASSVSGTPRAGGNTSTDPGSGSRSADPLKQQTSAGISGQGSSSFNRPVGNIEGNHASDGTKPAEFAASNALQHYQPGKTVNHTFLGKTPPKNDPKKNLDSLLNEIIKGQSNKSSNPSNTTIDIVQFISPKAFTEPTGSKDNPISKLLNDLNSNISPGEPAKINGVHYRITLFTYNHKTFRLLELAPPLERATSQANLNILKADALQTTTTILEATGFVKRGVNEHGAPRFTLPAALISYNGFGRNSAIKAYYDEQNRRAEESQKLLKRSPPLKNTILKNDIDDKEIVNNIKDTLSNKSSKPDIHPLCEDQITELQKLQQPKYFNSIDELNDFLKIHVTTNTTNHDTVRILSNAYVSLQPNQFHEKFDEDEFKKNQAQNRRWFQVCPVNLAGIENIIDQVFGKSEQPLWGGNNDVNVNSCNGNILKATFAGDALGSTTESGEPYQRRMQLLEENTASNQHQTPQGLTVGKLLEKTRTINQQQIIVKHQATDDSEQSTIAIICKKKYTPKEHDEWKNGFTIGQKLSDSLCSYKGKEIIANNHQIYTLSGDGIANSYKNQAAHQQRHWAIRCSTARYHRDTQGSGAGNGAIMRITENITPYLARPMTRDAFRQLMLDVIISTQVTHPDSFAISANLALMALLVKWRAEKLNTTNKSNKTEVIPFLYATQKAVETQEKYRLDYYQRENFESLEANPYRLPSDFLIYNIPNLSFIDQTEKNETINKQSVEFIATEIKPENIDEKKLDNNSISPLTLVNSIRETIDETIDNKIADTCHSRSSINSTWPALVLHLHAYQNAPFRGVANAVFGTQDNDTIAATLSAALLIKHGDENLNNNNYVDNLIKLMENNVVSTIIKKDILDNLHQATIQ